MLGSARNRSKDGTAHQRCFLEPLGEHSMGCLAHAGPARIGGRLRQILPDAWEPPEKGGSEYARGVGVRVRILSALRAREKLTWKGRVWADVITQGT